MGVRNHYGGRLGPPEVIFDLFEKIDFKNFFSVFRDFLAVGVDLQNSVLAFRPTKSGWNMPDPTLFDFGDRGSTWEARLTTIRPVCDPLGPIS